MIGIPLALVRFLEPFVLQEFIASFWKTLRSLRCQKEKKKRKRVRYSHEPLCAFVNSAMNIEFVYLILLGINNFMDNREAIMAKNQGRFGSRTESYLTTWNSVGKKQQQKSKL